LIEEDFEEERREWWRTRPEKARRTRVSMSVLKSRREAIRVASWGQKIGEASSTWAYLFVVVDEEES